MDELMLDGNAVAGPLRRVFAVEMTTATATCASCGAPDELGAMPVFRGAGIVMRCRACGAAVVTLIEHDTGVSIGLAGVRLLHVPT